MNEFFDRLQKAARDLAGAVPGDAAPEKTDDGKVEMSPSDFVGWVTAEIEKAAKDSNDVRKARVTHLLEQIAEVRKEFEGSPNVPTVVRAAQFKDPGQQTITSSESSPQAQGGGQTAFSQNTAPEPAALPNTPPGGQTPPATAPSSGFETVGNATFAKAFTDALEKMNEAIAKMGAPDPSPQPNAKGDDKGEGRGAAAKTEKSAKDVSRVLWPMDMNTAFGRGETEDPESPEWGFDHEATADDKTDNAAE